MLERGPDRPDPPAIILVEPQMPENIGMAARAMANFGFRDLRLVNPREGWPHPAAFAPAAGADAVLEGARVFPDTASAVADLRYVLATTARPRGQMKRVLSAADALSEARSHALAGHPTGLLFGRERTGLENDDISLADAVATFPIDPAFPSVNLAAAVLLIGYEWRRAEPIEATAHPGTPPAERGAVASLFDFVEDQLERAGFYPPNKKPIMARNMRDMFHRMGMTEQDVRTWRGAVRALAEGRARRKV